MPQIDTSLSESPDTPMDMLLAAIQNESPDLRDHARRVADLASSIALLLRPGDIDLASQAGLAGLLHDLGKTSISGLILNKNTGLSQEEIAEVRRHPAEGERLLTCLVPDQSILLAVRSHHERWDGRGYPDGLSEETIPLAARIIAVADTYDALVSSRTYRPGVKPGEALKVLLNGSGKQWDPGIVGACRSIILSGWKEKSWHPKEATGAAAETATLDVPDRAPCEQLCADAKPLVGPHLAGHVGNPTPNAAPCQTRITANSPNRKATDGSVGR